MATSAHPGGLVIPAAHRLLTPIQLMARRPLGRWSEELLGFLNDATSTRRRIPSFEHCQAVIGYTNQAALVQAHAGLVGNADALCDQQIRWLQAIATCHGMPSVLLLIVQPWINKGRLAGRRGDINLALRCFTEVRAYTARETPLLAGCEIGDEFWPLLDWDRTKAAEFGELVLAFESLSVFLAQQRYDDVLRFEAIFSHRIVATKATYALQEASVVALGQSDDPDRAVHQARLYERSAEPRQKLVFRYRAAEVRALANEIDAAASEFNELIRICRKLRIDDRRSVAFLLLVQQIVRAAWMVAASPEARAVAEEVIAGARRLDDEVVAIETLQLLAREETGQRDTAAAMQLRENLASTGYARFRAARNVVACQPVVNELFRTAMRAMHLPQ